MDALNYKIAIHSESLANKYLPSDLRDEIQTKLDYIRELQNALI